MTVKKGLCKTPSCMSRKVTKQVEPGARLIGYARVSTLDQDLKMQIDALRRAGVQDDNIYTDKRSGKDLRRLGLQQALLDARPGDTLVVWRFDRLSRSLKDLIMLFEQLEKEGIELKSLHEQLDTRTPMGKLMFHLAGILAEFERNLTVFRTKEGMAAAKKTGAVFGPPPKLDPKQVALAVEMLESGAGPVEVAKHFGVSRVTIYKEVQRMTGRKIWRPGPLAPPKERKAWKRMQDKNE